MDMSLQFSFFLISGLTLVDRLSIHLFSFLIKTKVTHLLGFPCTF